MTKWSSSCTTSPSDVVEILDTRPRACVSIRRLLMDAIIVGFARRETLCGTPPSSHLERRALTGLLPRTPGASLPRKAGPPQCSVEQ